MKIKPLNINFESLEDFQARSRMELSQVLKARKAITPSKGSLTWASVEAYQQFMSDQKYAILAAISKYHPQSVYQLAKILNRAQQNVARDCNLLAGHGFIKFEDLDDARKSKAPRLSFAYNAVVVHLPSVAYKVEFEEAV